MGMVVNKTRFSNNPHWAAALNKRAKLLFGDDWEYNPDAIRVEESGAYLTLCGRKKSLTWRYTPKGGLELWSGDERGKHDPVPDIPAYLDIAKDGRILLSVHCHSGSHNDPASGRPAYQVFYDTGELRKTAHCKSGKRENPSKNDPAEISYSKTGEMEVARSFRDGKNRDSASGLPARILYDKAGNVAGGYSSDHGLFGAKKGAELVDAAKLRACLDIVGENQIVALSGKSPTLAFLSPHPTQER